MRILVVEDDDVLLELLTHQLSEHHYAIDGASDGKTGWEYVSTYKYDLIILDVLLPLIDGISLCQRVRQAGYTIPVLMLTSQNTSNAKITGLNAGADDYMVKPFDEAELIARIRALLRRGSSNPLPIIIWGDLWLNSNSHEVSYAGDVLDLTAKEYGLLEMMLRESQHVFSKEEILESLWSSEEFPVDATVRSHMRRLRNKLTAGGAPPDFISTSHGRGYYLKPCTATVEVFSELDAGMDPDPDRFEMTKEQAKIAETSSDLAQLAISAPSISTQNEVDKKRQIQYWDLLNRTWQNNRSNCLNRVEQIRAALGPLQANALTAQIQADAYRAAHNLVGTLGTFGMTIAMELSRKLEQELHPDVYPDASQAELIESLIANLQHQLDITDVLPNRPESAIEILGIPESIRPALGKPALGNPGSNPDLRLMVVDDDPILLQSLAHQLAAYNFQVSTLDDPQQFWIVLNGVNPDCLILDMQMPSINGLQLCQELRANLSWQKLPVFFLSALADSRTQQDAFAVGADDYLCKPMTAKDLSDRIHYRLSRIQTYSQ
jgi:DNA-binding response OmpR family regulator/HPt (histidine-containing phosphotransfer) domain-containing protein